MSAGEIFARHYATREPVRLCWDAGKITSREVTSSGAPPGDLWLAPALLDLQINGYGGIDFQQDNLTREDLLRATRALHADGCATFLLTLITDAWPKMMARLRRLRALRGRSPELQTAIAGWHIEGPFLSAETGFCGAHYPAVMCDPTPALFRELREITGDDPLLLTLAPERNGAIAAIQLAVSLGIKVSLGHTDASVRILRDAVQAGATGFTHLANGCPRELDRHDNILWRVLETPGLAVSLIPDRIHVSPPLFRLVHRMLAPDTVYYTTDAMAAAGAPPGRYKLGTLELDVGADQIVRLPGSPNFAGSALRPVDGVFRAAQMLDCPWQETWARASERPAKFMGLHASLAVDQPATFCLLKVTDNNQLETLQVCVRGKSTAKNADFLAASARKGG